MTKEQVDAINAMLKTPGWTVLSDVLKETLGDVEKIILNGIVPEGEMLSYVARRRFLIYMINLPSGLITKLSEALKEPIKDTFTSRSEFYKKFI